MRQAAKLGEPMDPEIAEPILQPFNQIARAKPSQAPDFGLSERERQILEQMAQGLVNKENGDVLDIKPHTVVNRMRRIYP